jgi:hypothetical protein
MQKSKGNRENLPRLTKNERKTKLMGVSAGDGEPTSKITSPVKIQSRFVSKMISRMPKSPALTGSFCPSECAMAEVPVPASFDKSPRQKPWLKATKQVGTVPPKNDLNEKADVRIFTVTEGRDAQFFIITKRQINT